MHMVRMAARLELTKAWLELEATLVCARAVRPVPNGNGLWWGRPIPTPSGVDRYLGIAASRAVRGAMGLEPGGAVTRTDAVPRDIRVAQELVLTALAGVQPDHRLPS